MRFSFKHILVVLAGGALLLPASVAAFPDAETAATRPSLYRSQRASALLQEIQKEATGLRKNAATLGTFARSTQHSWQSHTFYLDRVKGHINTIGERIAELQDIHDSVQPWQQQAITQVTTHAAQVAGSTQAAIVQLNDDRRSVLFPEYRDHLNTIADSSADLKQSVDKFIDYDKAHQKYQQLKYDLELESD